MRIEHDDSSISWDRVSEVFREVGWGDRHPDELKAAFRHSTYKVFVFDGPTLVGFGRTIDDGRFYATIVDVVVAPAWHRRGIGSAVVQDLQDRLKGFYYVTLTAVPEVQPFYRRLGWLRQTTAMLLPRSAKQAALNCDGM